MKVNDKHQNLLACDIETACAVPNCSDKRCSHALIPHQASITLIGIVGKNIRRTFRDLNEFKCFLIKNNQYQFVFHNGKFDLKHLSHHNCSIPLEAWAHDTQLLAFASLDKISNDFLEQYSTQRKEANKKLPRGFSHRDAGLYSLKSLAPYFLGVEPFWENPADHDSDEYVLKDCEYTFRLCELFLEKLEREGTLDFYQKRLLPWTKMLLKTEQRGIKLDMDLLDQLEARGKKRVERLKRILDSIWKHADFAYYSKEYDALSLKYRDLCKQAIDKLKDPSDEKKDRMRERYSGLFLKASKKLAHLNIDSPAQMAWLLRDHFKLNIEAEFRDKKTNIKELKDSTGTEVLHRLSKKGRKDIGLYLRYRETKKLVTSFFPTYRELAKDGILHCNFNPTGTRTGRLSSSDPNLQQVPGHLHQLFKARPGYKLACFDESAIEARVIAYYSEDPILFDLIKNKKDIHGFHTTLFFNLDCDPSQVKKFHKEKRDITKNIGFGLFYGAGANRIKQEAMRNGYSWSDEECRFKATKFKTTYESVYRFKQELDQLASKSPLTNLFGRKLAFPNKEDIYMQAFNSLVQSSASDLVLNSSYRIMNKFREEGIDAHILLLVHDELVIEIPEDRQEQCEAIIRHCMTDYALSTQLGNIPLETEGSIKEYWSK